MSVSLLDSIGSAEVDSKDYFDAMVSGFSITASLVADELGSTVNEAGNSKGLGNQTDLQLLMALRRKSGVVLTSGKTFLAESYKMPSQADLAILSRSSPELSGLNLSPQQKVHVLGENFFVAGYRESVEHLQSIGYRAIHSEFGIVGVQGLITSRVLDALFVSSTFPSGVSKLLEKLELKKSSLVKIGGLTVAIVAWQRDAGPLAG